jgi:hypothetical protein
MRADRLSWSFEPSDLRKGEVGGQLGILTPNTRDRFRMEHLNSYRGSPARGTTLAEQLDTLT